MVGWSSVGELPIVGPFACPLRIATIKSAVCASVTSLNLPHFVIAFFTLSWAVRLASGFFRGSPASGRITTATVCALSTKSGSTCFFLFFAPAWGASRRRARKAIVTRTDIVTSRHHALCLVIIHLESATGFSGKSEDKAFDAVDVTSGYAHCGVLSVIEMLRQQARKTWPQVSFPSLATPARLVTSDNRSVVFGHSDSD